MSLFLVIIIYFIKSLEIVCRSKNCLISKSDVGIEVTDEDLKKLADSFAKGRDELQKVKIFLTNLFSLDLKLLFLFML